MHKDGKWTTEARVREYKNERERPAHEEHPLCHEARKGETTTHPRMAPWRDMWSQAKSLLVQKLNIQLIQISVTCVQKD